jgi:hypothetical protein
MDSIYASLNGLLQFAVDVLQVFDLVVSNKAIILLADITTATIKNLSITEQLNLNGIIIQPSNILGTNQLVKTNFTNNITQSSGSNQLLDTGIGTITQSGTAVIVQSGTQWNYLKQTQVSDLEVLNSIVLPSDITIQGSSYTDDLTLVNSTLQQTTTAGQINTLCATDFYNGEVRFSNDITMIGGASTVATLKNLIVQGTSALGIITGTTITDLYNMLALKAPIASPTFTGTVSGITKAMVGLGNVDNTSDVNKPVSTATTTALNLKVNASGGTLTSGIASRLYIQNLGGLAISFPANTMGCITANKSSGSGELNFLTSGTSYPFGKCCTWETFNGTGYDMLLQLSKQGLLTVTGNIVSPTITQLNTDIALKAPLANPIFTGTVSGITKAMIGLTNCDDTSDLNKPISTLTQTALDLKANLASPTFTGTVSGVTKAMVGLTNCDDTSDINKPISTATQSALDLKANLVSPTFTGTVSGVTKAMVGLGNVDNTSDLSKPISTATQSALDLKANSASPTFTGTVSGITKTMVGLGNVDNTSDLSKPISTLTQSALNLKANSASPTFTGTVSGITKTMVGLGNVDNTSDVSKPISTLTQTALDLKLNASAGTLSGGIADRLYVRNLAGGAITFPTNTMACLTTNKTAGGGELNIVTSSTNYPFGRCCSWETYNGTGYDMLMILSKQGLLTVTGNIVSPTITQINTDIATKSNTASPTFTGTVTAPSLVTNAISSGSTTMDISASNYITMMGGVVLIENDGDVLAKSFTDNTGINKVTSTGISCNNLTVTTSMSLPIQPSFALMARASCTLKYNGTSYVMSNRQNFRNWPNISGTPFTDKLNTGVVHVLIDNATGLNHANFMVSASGSYNDGITGDDGIIIQISQKSSFSNGGSTIGYSFKVVITRTGTTATRADLDTLGRVDLMVFW